MLAPTKAILLMFFAYLVGSIPFGYLVSAVWGNIDIREHGSGNIGMTNVFRTLGPFPGLLTLILDILKGYFVVYLALLWIPYEQIGDFFLWGSIISFIALLTVLGHSYSVWLRFHGGKSVAVSLGVLSALVGIWVLVPFGVFILAVVFTRYVSVGSLLSGISVPVMFLIITNSNMSVLPNQGNPSDNVFVGFTVILAVLVIIRHIANIKRLIDGTENRIGSKKKKKKPVTTENESEPQKQKTTESETTITRTTETKTETKIIKTESTELKSDSLKDEQS